MARRSFGMGQGETSDVNINDSLHSNARCGIHYAHLLHCDATFIKQAGIEVLRPDALTAIQKPTVAILVAVGPSGEIWIDKKRGLMHLP